MNKVMITHAMLLAATQKSVRLGSLKNSISSGNRNLIGFIGEEIFHDRYPEATNIGSFDYDFVLKGKKIDVKTRMFSRDPSTYVNFNVPRVLDQKCDFYFICGVHEDLTHGWILGWITKAEYEKLPTVNAGDPLPQGNGTFKGSGTTVKLSDLHELRNDT